MKPAPFEYADPTSLAEALDTRQVLSGDLLPQDLPILHDGGPGFLVADSSGSELKPRVYRWDPVDSPPRWAEYDSVEALLRTAVRSFEVGAYFRDDFAIDVDDDLFERIHAEENPMTANLKPGAV